MGPQVVTRLRTTYSDAEIVGLDMGFYMTYGQAENEEVVHRDGLLPMGLAEGCRLKRDMPRDTVLSSEDVVVPENRLSDRVREEQNEHFFGARIQSATE